MSTFQIFNIAAQGMSAQSMRLNTTASNLANVDSVGTDEQSVYKARAPIFAAFSLGELDADGQSSSTGVKVVGISESTQPIVKDYQPNNPLANEEGYVFKSNVNMIQEMANMISASRSYANNAEIINTAKNMMMKTINIGQ
jgi:flagellar basal-body rod protein FlgC